MRIHHIGIATSEKNIKNYFFKPIKKFTYIDKNQNNKLIIGYNKANNLWMEFIIPLNKRSTVQNFLNKHGSSIHHFAYYVKDLKAVKKKYLNKLGYIYINSFKINIPCFGGEMETVFFYNKNIFIEFLSKYKKR